MQIDPEAKELMRKYFTFSRREYKASLALLFMTLAVWFFSDFKMYFFPEKMDTAYLIHKAAELDSMQDIGEERNPSTPLRTRNDAEEKYSEREHEDTRELFSFNPNDASDESLASLGFSDRQIKTIKNYIVKIGEIKSKTEFRKIYGISEKQYKELEPYIMLPETNPVTEGKARERKNKTIFSLELNTADSIELDMLPGIGMGYARRIIKYRSLLGGYIDISQLLEVYGFRQTLLDSIKPYITIDVTKVIKLNINKASIDELKAHPYIRYKFANAIVNYRQQHGNYGSLEQLKNVILITEEQYTRMKNYLTVD